MSQLRPADNTAPRTPPHALDAEAAILGAVLLEGVFAYRRVDPLLRPSDFYTEAHRLIYAGMRTLAERNSPIDAITVTEELRRAQALQESGGPAKLVDLIEQAAIAVNLDAYVVIVRDLAILRRVIQVSTRLVSDAFDASEDPQALMAAAEAQMIELRDALRPPQPFEPAENWRHIVESWRRGRIKLGFEELDRLNAGLAPGDFIVVGGRTSHGKSALMIDVALRLARQKLSVDYVTLEETPDAIVRRAVSNMTGITMLRLKDGGVSDREFQRAENAVRDLQDLPFAVWGIEQLKSVDENSVIPLIGAMSGQVLIVDHLQQISTRDQSRVYGLDRVVKRLYAQALRDRKILFLAAQLNRQIDERKGEPQLSDLRDSASLEMSARAVWLLHWKCKHDPKAEQTDYDLFVAKQSEGSTGRVRLKFEAWCGRFSDNPEAYS